MKQPRMRTLTAIGVATLLSLSACGGSSLNPGSAGSGREGPIRIGLIWPESGPFQDAGVDYKAGWELYLQQHGGRLGGREIKTFFVDEVDGRQAAQDGIRKLVEQDRVEVVVGALSVDSVMAVYPVITEKKIPFVAIGGRPPLTNMPDLKYTWHVSWRSTDPGQSIAEYMRSRVGGPVWAIGPDFGGGYEEIGGFVKAFTKAGGQLANPDGKPTYTPWPSTENYVPYLNQIVANKPKAVWAFYPGAPAIGFIKQYHEVVGDRVPLYVSGLTIENRGLLAAMGDAADGVYSTLSYAHDVDCPANRDFVVAFQAKHNEIPSLMNVVTWDAALVLDRAIAAAGQDPTSESINAAIAALGTIPSPRGEWRFATDHAPTQTWYLRQVRTDGRGRANMVITTLAVIGDDHE